MFLITQISKLNMGVTGQQIIIKYYISAERPAPLDIGIPKVYQTDRTSAMRINRVAATSTMSSLHLIGPTDTAFSGPLTPFKNCLTPSA